MQCVGKLRHLRRVALESPQRIAPLWGLSHSRDAAAAAPFGIRAALRDFRLTLIQSFRCVPLVLWGEGRRRLISFRDLDSRR